METRIAWLFLGVTFFAGSVAAAEVAATVAGDSETPWPYTVVSNGLRLLVYPPAEVVSWDGSSLAASAPVSVVAEEQEPIHGTIRISARTLIDKDTRLVTFDQYAVGVADFRSSVAARSTEWVAALRADAALHPKTLALVRLQAALEAQRARAQAVSQPLKNDPPTLILSMTPASLVHVDGAPVYRAIEGTRFWRIVNTHALLLKAVDGRHYMRAFDRWMTSASLQGSWAELRPPPPALDAVLKRAGDGFRAEPVPGSPVPARPPMIYVATQPAELIVTTGPPQWVAIPGTQLSFAANSHAQLFKLRDDQKLYVLVSGRWFRAADAAGPWEFVRADRLAHDFTQIPDDSPKASTKASVAGTAEAHEAALFSSIPQTAAVRIDRARLTPPHFDGEPRLAPIVGTSLLYAANSSTPIIQFSESAYYAVENGVWFAAPAIRGPWKVATRVPAAMYGIPSDSPLYPVTFVKVYGSSGDTVYLGYTEGYRGACLDPHSGVVVQGTGYNYSPWIGAMWFGRQLTYGSEWLGSANPTELAGNVYRRWGDSARASGTRRTASAANSTLAERWQ